MRRKASVPMYCGRPYQIKIIAALPLLCLVMCLAVFAVRADELTSNRHAALVLHRSALERLRAGGDAQRAREDFLKVLQLDPRSSAALFNLGVLAERDEQWTVARDYYQHAADTSADLSIADSARQQVARAERVIALNANGSEGRKVRDYEAALVHASDALDQKHQKDALAVLLPLIQAQPDRWEAPGLAAVALAGEGEAIDAIGYLRAAGAKVSPFQRIRFDQAIGMLLGVDRKFLHDLSGDGTASASNLNRDVAPRIPEAEAFLLVRDVPGAIQVLATISGEDSPRAVEATRMLHDLAPLAAFGTRLPERLPEQRVGLRIQSLTLDGDIVRALLPEIVTAEMRLLASPVPPFIDEASADIASSVGPAARAPAVTVPDVAPPSPTEIETREVKPSDVKPIEAKAAGSELFVQVGSFPDTAHADAMAAELRQKHYSSLTAVEHGKYRVLVGPLESMTKAREAVKRLEHGYPRAFIRSRAMR